MTQPRVRNVTMAVLLAGIGAGAFIIIGLGTILSATTQLALVVVGICSFLAATLTICHVEPPLGHAFVIRTRKGLRVVRGSAFLSPWQEIYPIPLITSKLIVVNFDNPPYPKTSDWLPVRVKVQAKVTFKESDEALIAAAQILKIKEEKNLYEEWEKDLEAIISKVLSERTYRQHIEERNVFEESVVRYWHSSTELQSLHLSLHRINLVDISQVNLSEAMLSEVDKSWAESTEKEIQADEASRQADSTKKSEIAATEKLKATEEGKRTRNEEENVTKIEITLQNAENMRIDKALQHETKMMESHHQEVINSENTKIQLSGLDREATLAKKKVETEETKRELSLKEAETNRKVKITEANTALEVERINNELLKDRIQGELDLEIQYLEIRSNELEMLKNNKDGDLRYLLAKEALSMSVEQSKAIASALGKARIIGAIGDLPQIEKILKTPIAIREVLADIIDVMDDELIKGVGRFFRGVAAIRKEAQPSVHKNNSSSKTTSAESEPQAYTTSRENEAPPPPPHNDGDWDNH